MSEHENFEEAMNNAPYQRQGDVLCDLHHASCILESVILLLKNYRNADDLGEASDGCWIGLALILDGVRQTLVDATEAVEVRRVIAKRSE